MISVRSLQRSEGDVSDPNIFLISMTRRVDLAVCPSLHRSEGDVSDPIKYIYY